jgi:hypothetical protein
MNWIGIGAATESAMTTGVSVNGSRVTAVQVRQALKAVERTDAR